MRRQAEVRVLSALVVAGAGCASNAVQSQPSAEVRLQAAVQGLCDAEALARDDDVAGARAAFLDRSHAYLHELAAEVTDGDPAAAARLLEAKQRLEAALESATDADGEEISELAAEVLDGLRTAALAAGLGEPACREEEAA